MPLSFFRDSVTILRAPIINKNGSEVRDWSNRSEHQINRVQVTPQATAREFGERTLQIENKRTLRAPYDADIQTGDRVIWDGETYEVSGVVYRTKSPTGRVSTTRCNLIRWDG